MLTSFSAFPDVTEQKLTAGWEFIVIACDGIWDVMTNEVIFYPAVPISKFILNLKIVKFFQSVLFA